MNMKIIAVVGPTASGKTALGVRLAKKLKGEVISADSRQVYRHLNLGTGKATRHEMAGIAHHLIDIADARRVYNASDFVRDGRAALADILARGKVPIIVGGTGFYIDALLGRMTLAEVPPNLKLREKLEAYSLERLQKRLQKLDPKRYASIDAKNPRRLIRAIEIALAAPAARSKNVEPLPHYDIQWIGLTLPYDELERKIKMRLVERLKKGMLAEARALHRKGLSYKRMEELGLEYRAMARLLQGTLSKAEMIAELEKEILRYAKRQMTWFKPNKDIVWLSPQAALSPQGIQGIRDSFHHKSY